MAVLCGADDSNYPRAEIKSRLDIKGNGRVQVRGQPIGKRRLPVACEMGDSPAGHDGSAGIGHRRLHAR
jgi:hypothetical protein